MRRTLILALVATVAVSACEKQRVDDLENRLARLENRVDQIEQRGAGRAEPGADADRRLDALRKIKDLAVQLSERTYREDASLAQGKGAVEVLVIPRDDPDRLRREYFLALQDIHSQDLHPLAGVRVKMGEKDYGTTPAQGPLRIDGLDPGSHEVSLSYEGLEPRSYPFEVRAGSVKSVVTFLLAPGEAAEQFQQILERYPQESEE